MKLTRKEKISHRKLKDLGSENSRLMNDLKRQCLILGRKICAVMPLDTELPEGYRIIIKPNTTNDPRYSRTPVLVNYRKHISIAEPVTREMVIHFTLDIAGGLLDKFEDFLEKHKETAPD